MTWHPSVRTRHLLVAVALTLAAVFTLAFFHASQLLAERLAAKREVAAATATHVFRLAQEAVFRPPQQEPRAAISGDATVRALLEAATEGGEFAYVVIAATDGEVIAAADPQGLRERAARGELRPVPFEALEQQRWLHQLWSLGRANRVYEVRIPISFRKQPFGEVVAGVPAPALWAKVRPPLQLLLIVALTTAALLMLAALVTSSFVPRALQRPLQELIVEINQIEREYTALHNALQSSAARRTSGPLAEVPSRNLQSATQRLRELSRRFADNRSEIEAMRDQFSQVISNLSERMVLLDREGCVMMASPEAERLIAPHLNGGAQANGAAGAGLRGRPLADVLGPAHPLVALVAKALAERQSAEQTLTLPGRPPQTVVASVQVFADNNQPAGALLVLRDFESIKRIETQLDYATRLAALSRITAGVAHEVKNPLHAMVLHLELLRNKLNEGRDPARHVDVLTSEVNRLNRVVQTFLDFTRPVELQMRQADLNALVRETVQLAPVDGGREEAHRVRLVEQYEAEPLPVEADADLLKQALLNIVVNACQAMPEGGQLTVTTERLNNSQARVTISDQGVGIPAEVREKIFNLYFTTKPQGSGIGLAQAFRAVQLHSGRIEVDSEIGVGTTFRIMLPTARE
jgi:signal transduction histidine kinase